MFGHVEFVVKAAPGAGIVSSAVLQSDDLDEIDWEWLGGDDNQVQSNYFGKGQTTTYNRGGFHAAPGNHDGFHKYVIDWTSEQVVWSIDGNNVRALTPAAASGQYPQTPMMIKIGSWSGGDSANPAGTIAWAGGPTNYANGPFSMEVKSVAVTDYSTGTSYSYSGTSGTWDSIQAAGGKVNGNAQGAVADSSAAASAPSVTSASNPPSAFGGDLNGDSQSTSVSNTYPWVADPTATLLTATASVTSYPGLPSGWTVTSSGKVLPPSAAAVSEHFPRHPLASVMIDFDRSCTDSCYQSTFQATSSPAVFSLASPSAGLEVITSYDEQGFPTVVTVDSAAATSPKGYDSQGFLITAAPATATAASLTTALAQAAQSASTSASQIVVMASHNSGIRSKPMLGAFGAICAFFCGIMSL